MGTARCAAMRVVEDDLGSSHVRPAGGVVASVEEETTGKRRVESVSYPGGI